MTATIGSAYCRAHTDRTHYAPVDDGFKIVVSGVDTRATYCFIRAVIDNVAHPYGTAGGFFLSGGSGETIVLYDSWIPRDYDMHTISIQLYYSNGSYPGTKYGEEWCVNEYNTSSQYYYQMGRVGELSVTESWSTDSQYPLIVPQYGTGGRNPTISQNITEAHSTQYPGSVIDIQSVLVPSGDRVEITTSNWGNYMATVPGWAYFDLLNQLWIGKPNQYTFTTTLYYYDDYRDADNQYVYRSIVKTHTFTVYESVTPEIEIELVETGGPSWTTDDAPYNGKAPYRVTWKDMTYSRHRYMVPQQTINWNFGNPESGSGNVATQTNSGSSAITATHQTHVYPDYDSRTCEMTITDKLGNVTTGTARFSPSTKQRQFSDPVITKLYPTSGQTAPVIYKGETDLAGRPEPVPTWTYTLAGDSSYSGTVEGQYVEFSLLKGGTYTINYSVSLEGVTTTKSWTVTVDAPADIPDDSLSMPDFALIVLDSNHVPVDWCKQHTSVQYIEYYQDNDVFSFQIPTNYPYARYLQEGDYLVLGYNGKARLMQVTYRARTGSYITISGESVFPDRVAITATRSQANDGYDTQKSTGEALIRYFVQSCLIDMYSSTPQPRGAPFVLFGTDAGRGGDQTYSARYESLRDIVKELSASSNLGYTVACRDISGLSAGMTITQGTDRTYSTGGSNMAIFSPERLRNCRIDSDMGGLSHNVAIGARDGDGFVREYGWYGDTAETGFDRRELFVDAGEIAGTDADKTAEVQRMALLELKQERQLSIRLFVMPTCQWQFGTDYHVGDVVTLEHPDRGTIDLQIYSAELCRRETGDELYLNLGYECSTAPSLIRKTAYDNTYARK